MATIYPEGDGQGTACLGVDAPSDISNGTSIPLETGKLCHKCGELKAISEYRRREGRNTSSKICIPCNNEERRLQYAKMPEKDKERMRNYSRRRRLKNKEKAYNTTKAWRIANPGKRNESQRILYKKSPGKQKAANRASYEKHREKISAAHKKWRIANPMFSRVSDSRRNKMIRNNGVYFILPKEVKKLLSSNCINCGTPKLISLDHIIPVKRGGQTSIGNLQPLCIPCNSSKGYKVMTEWKLNGLYIPKVR